jgi:N-acetylmuramoyl-L-alanine amidase
VKSAVLLVAALVGAGAAAATGDGRRLTIVLDPGHGGAQEGAVSAGGAREKDVTLALARRVKARLERDLDADVRLTRDADELVHLADRVARTNAARADLFVSLHANSLPTPARRGATEGIETYFLSAEALGEGANAVAARENAEASSARASEGAADGLAAILTDLKVKEAHADSARLAQAVQRGLVAETGARDRGVHQAPLLVLTGLEAPAVLLEVGYLSHPREGVRLQTPAYQEALARGVSRGVADFLRGLARRDASH